MHKYNILNISYSTFNNLNTFIDSSFGTDISENLAVVSHIFTIQKSPFLAIIGGDLTSDKLYAIDTMLNFCEEIWLTGTLAIQFLIVQGNQNKFLEDYNITPY